MANMSDSSIAWNGRTHFEGVAGLLFGQTLSRFDGFRVYVADGIGRSRSCLYIEN